MVNNYLQHSTNWRSSQWGAFKEELARCQATSGCNVDGVYQRWTAIGNDQQKAAMSSMDAMLGADPSAAAEAGKNFGAAAAAMTVSPVDVCATGDARCAGFVGQQNNQAAAILRTGLVVAYANDLVEGGGKGKSTSAATNESPGKSAAENAAELTKAKVEAEIAALKKIGQNPDGPVLEGKAPNSVLNQQAVNDSANGILPSYTNRANVGVGAAGDLLAAANKPYNASSEQSVLSRAWDKHSGRPGGTFEQLKGNAIEKNATSEAYLRDLLNNPNTTRIDLSRGGFEYRLPNGQGVRFNADGSFNTLLDPRKP